jgi:hypothetical protein
MGGVVEVYVARGFQNTWRDNIEDVRRPSYAAACLPGRHEGCTWAVVPLRALAD